MPCKYGANLGTPGIGAALSLRVRHHAADLGADLVGWIAQPDRIAVRLRHPPTVESRQSRGFREQMPRLHQTLLYFQKLPELRTQLVENVFKANFGHAFSNHRAIEIVDFGR